MVALSSYTCQASTRLTELPGQLVDLVHAHSALVDYTHRWVRHTEGYQIVVTALGTLRTATAIWLTFAVAMTLTIQVLATTSIGSALTTACLSAWTLESHPASLHLLRR